MEKLEIFLLFLFCFYSLLISFIGINSSLSEGHHGFILGEKSRPAVYWLRFGYLKTKLGQLVNEEWELGKENYNYNVHHPVGLPLLISLSFKLFGISEFSARLVIIVVNLFSIIFFYFLVKEILNMKTALLSLFFFLLSPMFFYIRNFVAGEVFSLLFIFATLFFYIKYIKTEKRRYLFFSSIFYFIGTLLADWWVYFAILPIILHRYLFYKRYDMLVFLPISFLSFSFYLIHVYVLTGSFFGEKTFLGSLWERLLFRLNLSKESWQYGITFPSLLSKIFNYLTLYYTHILVSFSFFSFLLMLKEAKEKDISFVLITSFSFFLLLFIFSNITWIHDFFVLFLLFPMSVLPPLLFKKMGLMEKKEFLFILVVISLFLAEAIPTYFQIHKWFTNSPPIVKFVAENKGNFLVTYLENPEYHQFRFYADLRNVKTVHNLKEFFDLIKQEDFNYIIVQLNRPFDRDLFVYLENNFKSYKVSDEYMVFFLNETNQS
jgi:hypothetical protein